MEIETLKRSHLKRNVIIGVVVVLIISAIILTFTRAKYRTTQSIPLVNGTINYSLADLNIVGLYIDGEEATKLDSSKTYTLDTTQSTCTYKDGSEISDLNISYESETGKLTITPFTTKGTKCTLYFNEKVYIRDTLLANYPTVLTRNDFSTTVTSATTGTIYKSLDSSQYDDDGEVYYFVGAPTDNWVYFAGFYWRIIRVNGDGTIRLIYNGTSNATTGNTTQLLGVSSFNTSSTNNMYVGYMYQSGQVHGLTSSSNIKDKLDEWYINNLAGYADVIDTSTGFCGDRTSTTTNGGEPNDTGGTGTTNTYYGARYRLYTNKKPTFKCSDKANDFYTISSSNQGNKALTYPIGLITADEVAYAGGAYGINNASYYLYTGNNYWTISPSLAVNARIFIVDSKGSLTNGYVNSTLGIRPVINLKADITISSGNGTSTNPYVIS